MEALCGGGGNRGGLRCARRAHYPPSPSPPAALPRIEFAVDTPSTTDLLTLSVSPDGAHLAYVQPDRGTSLSRIWVRTLASQTARALEGTEDAAYIFWSADSRRIGFTARGRLHMMPSRAARRWCWAPCRSLAGARGTPTTSSCIRLDGPVAHSGDRRPTGQSARCRSRAKGRAAAWPRLSS